LRVKRGIRSRFYQEDLLRRDLLVRKELRGQPVERLIPRYFNTETTSALGSVRSLQVRGISCWQVKERCSYRQRGFHDRKTRDKGSERDAAPAAFYHIIKPVETRQGHPLISGVGNSRIGTALESLKTLSALALLPQLNRVFVLLRFVTGLNATRTVIAFGGNVGQAGYVGPPKI